MARDACVCSLGMRRGALSLGVDPLAGFPIASHFLSKKPTTQEGIGINGPGQIAVFTGNWGLIDVDTPKEAYTKQSYMSKDTLELVFSDEFNVEGRSFYEGDDPHWEAPNLYYWGTVSVGGVVSGESGGLMVVGVAE